MGTVRDSVKGFGVTFSHLFRRVVTTKYPYEHPVSAPRYHGRHILNRHPDGLEKCIGCELCAWACPADAIYVVGADNTEVERYSPGERYAVDYQINYARCIFCGLCIEACPTRSLTMSNEYELARDSRADLIFTKEMLLAPLQPGMQRPPHPMWLGESERDYYLDALTNPGTSAGAESAGNEHAGPTAASEKRGPVNAESEPADPTAASDRKPRKTGKGRAA